MQRGHKSSAEGDHAMHHCRGTLSLVLACCAVLAFDLSAARSEPRGVVELFTSQGCSSCPPADKLLGEMARDPSVIALTLPIDYWDYLGWKDTLAHPRHTTRQRGYALTRGDRDVYTPQVVVNGVVHALGSDKEAVEGAIAKTRVRPSVLSVPLKVSIANGHLVVKADPSRGDPQKGEVWLCAVKSTIPVAIGRGENKGRTITYHNVVRRWVKLGDWTGSAQSWTIPAAEFAADHADAVAVILQSGSADHPGTILGASMAPTR
jgi:hypothetical protein